MLWGRKRPRERTPVVWRQDAFPFFYSIWESARGSVFLARRADKTRTTAGNSFLRFQYIICGRICQGEIENSGSVLRAKKTERKLPPSPTRSEGAAKKERGGAQTAPRARSPLEWGTECKTKAQMGRIVGGGIDFFAKIWYTNLN